jgi:hypothetical protein
MKSLPAPWPAFLHGLAHLVISYALLMSFVHWMGQARKAPYQEDVWMAGINGAACLIGFAYVAGFWKKRS